jgi:mannose-6-phosphate isomerase
MSSIFNQPFLLHNPIQNYQWGTRNQAAFIPQLIGKKPKPDKPYAELWMGAHLSNSSAIQVENKLLLLHELIRRFPEEIIGKDLNNQFGQQLPFMLKVVSVAESLSIQAHPSKGLAVLLHKNDPDHYPDANHKPEIAIALDSLTLLVGFAGYQELHTTIKKYPEIAQFFKTEALANIFPDTPTVNERQTELIRLLFQTFVHLYYTKPLLYQEQTATLARRLGLKNRPSIREKLFLDAFQKYSKKDIGLFTIFFLRLVNLKPGEGLYIHPGMPHTYLRGNLLECMANSDNVIRSGLTRKFQDVKTLMTALDYSDKPAKIIKPSSSLAEVHYPTPAAEFTVSRFSLANNRQLFPNAGRVEILLVLGGWGTIRWGKPRRRMSFHRGQSFLIPAGVGEYSVTGKPACTVYRVQVP